MAERERIEWCDMWVEDADRSSPSRALLIGDSICRSYYPFVAEHLTGTLSCARFTSSKCVSDPAYVKELDLIVHEYPFSVVHINNGLHGWDYGEDAYTEGLGEVLDYLGTHVPTDRLIWGSTTPVWKKGGSGELDSRTDRVEVRNEIAERLALERTIKINDLYAELIGHPEWFSKDGVHLIEDGQRHLGKCVANAIRTVQSS